MLLFPCSCWVVLSVVLPVVLPVVSPVVVFEPLPMPLSFRSVPVGVVELRALREVS